jgi:hypothetical protein
MNSNKDLVVTEVSAQSLFDATVRHLRTMTQQSRNGRCMYRDNRGGSCAVGCHVTDDEIKLSDDFEGSIFEEFVEKRGRTWDVLIVSDVLAVSDLNLLPERLQPHVKLLASLQSVHDNTANWSFDGTAFSQRMQDSLRDVARLYDLSQVVIDEPTP